MKRALLLGLLFAGCWQLNAQVASSNPASATYGLGAGNPGWLVHVRSNSYSGSTNTNSGFNFIIFKQRDKE